MKRKKVTVIILALLINSSMLTACVPEAKEVPNHNKQTEGEVRLQWVKTAEPLMKDKLKQLDIVGTRIESVTLETNKTVFETTTLDDGNMFSGSDEYKAVAAWAQGYVNYNKNYQFKLYIVDTTKYKKATIGSSKDGVSFMFYSSDPTEDNVSSEPITYGLATNVENFSKNVASSNVNAEPSIESEGASQYSSIFFDNSGQNWWAWLDKDRIQLKENVKSYVADNQTQILAYLKSLSIHPEKMTDIKLDTVDVASCEDFQGTAGGSENVDIKYTDKLGYIKVDYTWNAPYEDKQEKIFAELWIIAPERVNYKSKLDSFQNYFEK